eukprot:gene10915-biopygen8520
MGLPYLNPYHCGWKHSLAGIPTPLLSATCPSAHRLGPSHKGALGSAPDSVRVRGIGEDLRRLEVVKRVPGTCARLKPDHVSSVGSLMRPKLWHSPGLCAVAGLCGTRPGTTVSAPGTVPRRRQGLHLVAAVRRPPSPVLARWVFFAPSPRAGPDSVHPQCASRPHPPPQESGRGLRSAGAPPYSDPAPPSRLAPAVREVVGTFSRCGTRPRPSASPSVSLPPSAVCVLLVHMRSRGSEALEGARSKAAKE